ncbi:MAG: acyltransferase [Propionibacteriaceae bacterium]|jgi:fucose 4-O-acetylase-like acetyltransferase|nr:acyltransferase [Propionibacteriaceae bacterium]
MTSSTGRRGVMPSLSTLVTSPPPSSSSDPTRRLVPPGETVDLTTTVKRTVTSLPTPTIRTPRRDQSIDTLRGIAVIAMVAGHVVGSTADNGMTVADDSLWRHLYTLFADLRMPLFTALSGFVYALRPVSSKEAFPRFLLGKVRRLLVPLVTVGTVFMVTQALLPGANSNAPLSRWWTVYVVETAHFWFLQAVFVILIVVALIDLLGLDDRPVTSALWIAGTGLLSLTVTVYGFPFYVFSLDRAVELLPFFLVGRALCRHRSRREGDRPFFLVGRALCWFDGGTGRAGWVFLATAIVLFLARFADIFLDVDLTALQSGILGTLLGLSGIAALICFRQRLTWAPLARLGYFSFAIYLLHVFGVAGSRVALSALGVENEVAVFVTGLICGIALPVVFEVTLGRISWISWAFLGQRAYVPAKTRRSSI